MRQDHSQADIEITCLGQAGFIVTWNGTRIVIDPYLSNYVVDGGIGSAELFSRTFPPPLAPDDITGVDLIFLTHDHADHCDPLTVLPLQRANLEAKFVCPRPVAEHLMNLGVEESSILVPPALELIQKDGFEYYAVPAAHYGHDRDELTGEYAYYSFMIRLGTRWLFHAGDTIDTPGYSAKILYHATAVDIACLPVNGRDAEREALGIIGNMNGAEALKLGIELKSRVILPMHNDLFACNHEDPNVLNDLVRQQKPPLTVRWMKPGETINL